MVLRLSPDIGELDETVFVSLFLRQHHTIIANLFLIMLHKQCFPKIARVVIKIFYIEVRFISVEQEFDPLAVEMQVLQGGAQPLWGISLANLELGWPMGRVRV